MDHSENHTLWSVQSCASKMAGQAAALGRVPVKRPNFDRKRSKFMFAIRWLGAFGRHGNFPAALKWELEDNTREVAAEWFSGSPAVSPDVEHCAVGLLVAKGAVMRCYSGDVWSVPSPSGERLVPTRPASEGQTHSECFCKPHYRAFVIRKPLDQLRPVIRRPLVSMARKHGLPVLWLRRWCDVYRWHSSFITIKF